MMTDSKSNTVATRAAYTAPQIEVIEMENEGSVMVSSLTGEGAFSASRSASRSYSGHSYGGNSASSSDFEEMINDILTVKQ